MSDPASSPKGLSLDAYAWVLFAGNPGAHAELWRKGEAAITSWGAEAGLRREAEALIWWLQDRTLNLRDPRLLVVDLCELIERQLVEVSGESVVLGTEGRALIVEHTLTTTGDNPNE